MNTRPLTANESKNLAALHRAGCKTVLLFLTDTGMRKAILDATEPMRALFAEAGIHDFTHQPQGPAHKVVKSAQMLTDTSVDEVSVSLYRPVTKGGDPRMWFYGFTAYASADDVVAVFVHSKMITALNLTRSAISRMLSSGVVNPVTSLLRIIASTTNAVSEELLERLRSIAAKGPIKAVCKGSTAVGRSIETALGIPINSSRDPDFKGIEIKSGRSSLVASRENRATLFACVADWDISALKSSRAILDRFGYKRGGDFKLYCTVSARKANSQGLQFELMDSERLLREFYNRKAIEEVCIWTLDKLHKRLKEKHRETFWIRASTVSLGGGEWFQLSSVTHTSEPDVNQFDRLLADGTVTMDHLIKRTAAGRVSEKGPLFKIPVNRIRELFLGEPQKYNLVI